MAREETFATADMKFRQFIMEQRDAEHRDAYHKGKYGKYTFVGVLVLMLFGAGNRILGVYTVGHVGANNITMRVSYGCPEGRLWIFMQFRGS